MSENSKPGIALYMGFVAWLAYSALGAWGYWKTAACAGLVIMLEIVAWEVHARRVKIIDCTSLGFFFLAIVALVTLGEGYFIRYQVVFGWGLFAAVAWITMIAGVPFGFSTLDRERRVIVGMSRGFAGFISGSVSRGRSSSRSIPRLALSHSTSATGHCWS